MAAHEQVWIKVNAQVDSGMAEVVSVLNEVDGLQTIESCQGMNGRQAFVFFYYGNWSKICEFMFGKLALALMNVDGGTSLSVEIFNGSFPMGKLLFDTEATVQVASALREVVSNLRSYGYSDGKPYTVPHSSPAYQDHRQAERRRDGHPKSLA